MKNPQTHVFFVFFFAKLKQNVLGFQLLQDCHCFSINFSPLISFFPPNSPSSPLLLLPPFVFLLKIKVK